MRRAATVAALLALLGGTLALSVLVSVWFLVAVPVLSAGLYAAAVGMSPSRLWEAIDDTSSSAPHPF